jgi:hypothetical protein
MSRLDPFREVLGIRGDADIARDAGVSREYVRQYREKAGVARPTRKASKYNIARKAKTDAKLDGLLGTMSDEEIAIKLRMSRVTVGSRRRAAGIDRAPNPMKTKWSPEHLDLLGTIPDKALAKLVGCNFMTVWRKRRELGIPAMCRR